MNVFTEIVNWSAQRPEWQQDALRRLVVTATLSDDDHLELLKLAKKEYGLPVDSNAIVRPICIEHVPTISTSQDHVSLLSLYKLQNVNLIAEDGSLKFDPDGLTIVFGVNGSGKSGYSRVLKRACRARDTEQTILPNVLKEGPFDSASAQLQIKTPSGDREISWIDGQTSDEELARIAVFDGHGARVYVTEDNDVAFMPYGLDVLTKLAGVCDELRKRLESEASMLREVAGKFDDLLGDTKVGKLLTDLQNAKVEDIEQLANLSKEEVARLIFLKSAITKDDPKKERDFRLQHSRLVKELHQKLRGVKDFFSTEKLSSIKTSFNRLKVAITTERDVRALLSSTANPLPGTGNESWVALLNAAINFSDNYAYAGHQFPYVDKDAKCVLCQQLLAQDQDRLKNFGEFMRSKARKELVAAQSEFSQLIEEVKECDTDSLLTDNGTIEQIKARAPELEESIRTCATKLQTLKSAIIKISPDVEWDNLIQGSCEEIPSTTEYLATCDVEIKTYEGISADKAKIEAELRELAAREKFSTRKSEVLATLADLKLKAKFTETIRQFDTTQISKKAAALTNDAVSEALQVALNDELTALGVGHLKTELESSASKGITSHRLSFGARLPSRRSIVEVLSEGEHRAIGLAAFFAEIGLSGSLDPMVFDDPVSSLDYQRRINVSKRIAREATKRQIIVFTHDVVFMRYLIDHYEELGKAPSLRTLNRSANHAGHTQDEPPFDEMKVGSRLSILEKRLADAKSTDQLGKMNESQELIRSGMRDIRKTWERVIEEILFNGVIQRFDFGVKTQSLAGVSVAEQDYREIDAGMSSTSFELHDQAPEAQVPPTLIQFNDEYNRLKSYIQRKKLENKATQESRR